MKNRIQLEKDNWAHYSFFQLKPLKSVVSLLLVLFSFSMAIPWHAPKPKLFLIGDSISIQYYPYLKDFLVEIAELERKEDNGQADQNLDIPQGANGGDSKMVLAYLKSKTNDPDFKPDYLLLNCGLHDIKHNPDSEGTQVDSVAYRENLEAIYQLLSSKGIGLIWIQTTQVIDSVHNMRSQSFKRYAEDVTLFNGIAAEVCDKHQIPVIDLYTHSVAMGRDAIRDHVHYYESGRIAQASYIAGFLQYYLHQHK